MRKEEDKERKRLGAVRYEPIHEKECKTDLLHKPPKLENWKS